MVGQCADMARHGRRDEDPSTTADPSEPLRGTTVSARIAEARERARLKKAQLARLCEVTWQTVHNWESGRPPTSAETLSRIAEVTGYPLEQIVHGTDGLSHVPEPMQRALELYARRNELTPRQISQLASLTLEFRGGPPTDPGKYISLFEHILNDGGEPVRAAETEAKAQAEGVRKVRRQRRS